MKKSLTIIGLFSIAMATTIQPGLTQDYPTDKGSTLLTGNIVLNSSGGDLYGGTNGIRATSLMATPSLSYFMTPGLAIGGKLLFNRASQGGYNLTTWGLGPQIIYFIGGSKQPTTIKGKIYPYFGASFIYEKWIAKLSPYHSKSGMAIAFAAGIMNMISNSIGLIAELGYQIENMKSEGENFVNGNKFNILVGISACIY